MPTYLNDNAICLRVTDFSETSQVVGLFTREHGLVPLIAKGSKRESKKNTMSGPLDLLTSGEVVFIAARESGMGGANARNGGGAALGTLAAWELTDHRQALRGNLAGLNAGMMCAEVTVQLVQPYDPHPDLFDQLRAGLELLALPAQRARAAVAYLKAALVAAGYWPQFGECLACGRPAPASDAAVRFSARAGGIVCAECHVENAGTSMALPGRVAVALNRLPSLTELQADPPERAADVQALATALQLLLEQVELITDRPLRTRYLAESITRGSVAGAGSAARGG